MSPKSTIIILSYIVSKSVRFLDTVYNTVNQHKKHKPQANKLINLEELSYLRYVGLHKRKNSDKRVLYLRQQC